MCELESIGRLLESYERSLLEPSVRKSELVPQLLAESFVEFGSSGRVFTKAQIVAALHAEPPLRVSASGFEVRLLAPHVALATYRTCKHTQPEVHALRSSIWEKREGKWQMVFHQGTLTQAQS